MSEHTCVIEVVYATNKRITYRQLIIPGLPADYPTREDRKALGRKHLPGGARLVKLVFIQEV